MITIAYFSEGIDYEINMPNVPQRRNMNYTRDPESEWKPKCNWTEIMMGRCNNENEQLRSGPPWAVLCDKCKSKYEHKKSPWVPIRWESPWVPAPKDPSEPTLEDY